MKILLIVKEWIVIYTKPRCEKVVSRGKENQYRPFCSKKCKLIDLGEWANEEKKISRPIQSEDFYED